MATMSQKTHKNILFGIAGFFLFVFVCYQGYSYLQQKKIEEDNKKTQEIVARKVAIENNYSLGWVNEYDSMLAKVEKIVFDKEGEVLEIISYSSKTKIRAEFTRPTADTNGEYHQPGETGGWYLKKSSDGHVGKIWDDRGQKATLFVRKY